jgi:hypothetical protein
MADTSKAALKSQTHLLGTVLEMQSTLNLHLKLARDDMATTNFVLTALIR